MNWNHQNDFILIPVEGLSITKTQVVFVRRDKSGMSMFALVNCMTGYKWYS